MTVLGVVADTHIPDRARRLDPRIGDVFRAAGVEEILHAGDISARPVLQEISQIAPVHAVRGNRDWVALRHLPLATRLTYGDVTLALSHGHGRWWRYLINRIDYLIRGYRLELFQSRLIAEFSDAQVIIFGHTHRPFNQWVDGRLLFNPGSPHCPDGKIKTPSVGLLHIGAGGDVLGEIISLETASLEKRV
ncbi:MAG TPA: metallophosphoesterase family protein [Anaerolineales bacterium]|nr:metallophosphoesterase family protein [Anaerolineales bacterium]